MNLSSPQRETSNRKRCQEQAQSFHSIVSHLLNSPQFPSRIVDQLFRSQSPDDRMTTAFEGLLYQQIFRQGSEVISSSWQPTDTRLNTESALPENDLPREHQRMFDRDLYINSPLEIESQLLRLLDKDSVRTVFDIGACEAEDSIRYSRLFPNAKVYAFEPRQDNLDTGVQLAKKYACNNIHFEKVALSESNGSAEFFLSDGEPGHLKNSDRWNFGNKSSSLLPPSSEMKIHTAWLQFNESVQVKTIRLDDYVASRNISEIDFAHIDVQGAELMVLRGAGEFLNKIKLIWMEVEAVELYQGQPLKKDVEHFMLDHNFVNILDTVDQVSGDQLYANLSYFDRDTLRDEKQPG